MGIIDNLNEGEQRAQVARTRALEVAAPLVASSITRGRLRIGGSAQLLVDSSGGIVVNGSFAGAGTFNWTGPTTLAGSMTLSGPMSITGTQTVTGTVNLNGPVNIAGTQTVTGTLNVNGPVNIAGAATLSSTLTCSGSIVINGSSNMTLGTTFAGAGLTFGTGAVLSSVSGGGAGLFASTTSSSFQISNALAQMAVGSKSVLVTATTVTINGNTQVNGNHLITGTKSFLMDHPTRPGMWLQHASTESPVSGVEYWGGGTFNTVGECQVSLPDYFEALAKPEGRIVIVSAVGRPFLVGADTILRGAFIVYGDAGRSFTWSVKAERFTADFEVEWEKPERV